MKFQKNIDFSTSFINKMAIRNILIFIKKIGFINKHGELPNEAGLRKIDFESTSNRLQKIIDVELTLN